VIQYHLVVRTALALIIIGIVKLEGGNAGATVLMKIRIAVMFLCWVILVTWTLISLRSYHNHVDAEVYADGTKVSTSLAPS
jgi:hypothetical protein